MASAAPSVPTAAFMEEVQKYNCIYNKYSKDFKNKFIKINCWKKIGEKFCISPEEAEKKYKYIRTGYGRWLKRKKSVPSGSGRDAVPRPPPEYENLGWLADHIRTQHSSISNLQKQEESQQEVSEVDVDEMSENIEFGNEFDDQDESNSESNVDLDLVVTKTLPSEGTDESPLNNLSNTSISDSNPSPEEVKVKRKNSKIKHSWAKQKKEQAKAHDVDMELLKTAKSIADGFLSPQEEKKSDHGGDEDTLYCRSVAARMKCLDPQSKAYVRMQIEQLLFTVQFSGQGQPMQFSGRGQPMQSFGQGLNLPMPTMAGQRGANPYQEPSVCPPYPARYPDTQDPYEIQNLN